MMAQLTQPLRDEHQELLPHIKRLQTVADAIGTAPITSLRQDIDEAYAFLTRQLIPHAQAEERALYPVVGRLMGAPEATATMNRDHVEIGRLTEELGALRSYLESKSLDVSQEQALRRVLYSLSALVAVHFAKEEEIYLPILDGRLTPEKAHRLFEAMEQAAQEAKSTMR
ncbi:MAG TPA: hemerythrin domain-containing protein [Ktedonobacteraceae bacterium]|jgi:iron-sulfur cluster repair protein YtfE (RIC family)|nr:hemerythrin domain-containing protein [Ktedonobacteraceae bacterium]